jgi:hypothetical protein
MARQASSRRAAAGSSDRQDARRNAQVGFRTGRSRALLPRRDRKYTRTARGKRITSPASSARAPAPRPTVATHWPARSRSPVAAGSPPSAPEPHVGGAQGAAFAISRRAAGNLRASCFASAESWSPEGWVSLCVNGTLHASSRALRRDLSSISGLMAQRASDRVQLPVRI